MSTTMSAPTQPLTDEQKEFLQGLAAALAVRGQLPGGAVAAPPTPAEQKVFDTLVADLCKEERWKLEENPLDIWEKLLAHADQDKLPDAADTFRFKFHGLFNVAPAQDGFMLRCRIPGGVLTAAQLKGLADIAEQWGGGHADVTTRSNIQVRQIRPANIIRVLTKLQEIGLGARGAGADNVRNITASPTSGIDYAEVYDVRPLANALHHYILNCRDLYGLPRKFNVAFDNGGSVSVLADTNDIGFVAVQVGADRGVEPGAYFRVQLAGITGHQDFARDAGILVKPNECVAVAAAMIRVFNEHGDRTNRKKARLKYLLDAWGIPKFLEAVGKKVAFPLVRFPREQCEPRRPVLRHGHVGVYRQSQKGLNYIGVVIPVGRMKPRQMRLLADQAANYGSSELRLTVWQNLIVPNIPDAYVETVKRNLVRIGFHYESTTIAGGLVACTGKTGCKYAATNTKVQAVALARHLEKRVQLDHPINIHLTGCPHSCAQHYIGDIGLLGVTVERDGKSLEGYNVTLGGGADHEQGIGREIFRGVPFDELPALLEKVLTIYKQRCKQGETFVEFTRRHELKELQEMFTN
ncbi:MAG: NirA family protein [Verrucomicrobia bacterium]|nr:NirA family protein [Verrucomicrobiota bacterium]